MRRTAVQPLRQVVCPGRRVQQFRVIVQLRNINGDHRLASIHGIDDVLIVAVFHDEFLICQGAEQRIQQAELVIRDRFRQFLAVSLYDFFINPQSDERILRGGDGFLRVGKLRVQERLNDAEGFLLVLVPAVAAEGEIIRRTCVSQAVGAFFRKHPRLTDVGIVLRLQPATAKLVVVLIRRNVCRISLHLLCELDRALPDGVQLRCRERRFALRRAFEEQVVSLVADPVLLQHTSGEV